MTLFTVWVRVNDFLLTPSLSVISSVCVASLTRWRVCHLLHQHPTIVSKQTKLYIFLFFSNYKWYFFPFHTFPRYNFSDIRKLYFLQKNIPSTNPHLRYEIPVSYFKCTNKILNCKHMSQGGVLGDKLYNSMVLYLYELIRWKQQDWFQKYYQDNVSVWSDMSVRRLLFQWASTIKIQLSVLV